MLYPVGVQNQIQIKNYLVLHFKILRVLLCLLEVVHVIESGSSRKMHDFWHYFG